MYLLPCESLNLKVIELTMVSMTIKFQVIRATNGVQDYDMQSYIITHSKFSIFP
jgi:hypothetical protein